MTLRIVNLNAGYGRIEVCRQISLTLENGEYLAVLGPNGAGKSTLLGAIAGSVIARGQIELNGKPLHRGNARDRARHGLALVPEGRRNLFPPLTVYENLQLGLRLLPKGDRAAMLQSLLDLFPILGPRRMQVAGLLSGGEQQMLALAVSLARRPSVLLLDEPSQGLAPMLLENLAQQIIAMRSLGVSVLLAEQNHRFAAQLCDRYVVLTSGELTGGGTREDLQNTNNVTAALMV